MEAGSDDVAPGGCHVGDVFELVPEFGADDAGEDDHGDDAEGVRVGAVANEIFVQNDGAADGGEPEHQAKRSNMSKTEIQIGIHAGLSIGPARTARVGPARTARVKGKGGSTALVPRMPDKPRQEWAPAEAGLRQGRLVPRFPQWGERNEGFFWA